MAPKRVNLTVAALAGWLIPGAGHLLLGMRRKALFYFLLLTGTYLAGLVLAGYHAVDYDRHPIYFLAYAFDGLTTLLAWAATAHLDVKDYISLESLGTLYCAVASLLNFLVVLDVFASAERRAHGGGEGVRGGARGGARA